MRVERPLPVDGQPARMTELWVWTAIDPLTDVEGVVASRMPGGGAMPLVSMMRAMAERLGPVARAAMDEAGDPKPVLQLRRFVADD